MAGLRSLIVVIVFCFASILTIENLLQVSPHHHVPDPVSRHRLYPSNLSLVNLPHFKYLINNDVCARDDVYMMVLVTSHPSDTKLREAMREILPQIYLNRIGVKRIFLLARAETNQSDYHKVDIEKIQAENLRNSDLLVGDFVESYRNLTLKHVMGLQWAVQYCPQSKWIMKMDDDIAVDVFQILNILRKRQTTQVEKPRSVEPLLGLLQLGMKPLRNTSSKWYVTWEEYPFPEYAPYLSGWAYILTPTTAYKLVQESAKVPYFWIDDAHITGTIAKKLGINRKSLNSYYTVYAELLRCCYTLPDHWQKLCDYAVGPTMGDSDSMRRFLWQTRHCYHNRCTKRTRPEKIENLCIKEGRSLPVLGREKGEVIPLRL